MTLLLAIMLIAVTDLSWWWMLAVVPVWIMHIIWTGI